MSRFQAGDIVEVKRDRRSIGLEGLRGHVEIIREGSGRTVFVKFDQPHYHDGSRDQTTGSWFQDNELEDVEQRLVAESFIQSVLHR